MSHKGSAATFPASLGYLAISRGEVAGYSEVQKFGKATLGTTLAAVTQSGTYMVPTTATALEFVSASADDAAAGSHRQSGASLLHPDRG